MLLLYAYIDFISLKIKLAEQLYIFIDDELRDMLSDGAPKATQKGISLKRIKNNDGGGGGGDNDDNALLSLSLRVVELELFL